MHKNKEFWLIKNSNEKTICARFIYKKRDKSTFMIFEYVNNYLYYYSLIIIKYYKFIIYFKVTHFIDVHFSL